MRLCHTSDWHLGKRLYEASLLDEQAHVLEQIFTLCRDERVDALIVAGDLYDRSVPPVEAVKLLDDVLARFTRDLGIPVIAISGNHDSPDRVGFGAGVLERAGVHLRTTFARRAAPVFLERGRRRLSIYCLPFLEPEVARGALGDDSLVDHGRATEAALAAVHADRAERRTAEAVLVAHLFADGGRESPDSERPLVVGGAAHVGLPVLTAGQWSYVALGHLHEAQPVGDRADVRYSGAPLKYSFSEAEQQKSVTLVDIVCGRAAVRAIPLTPRRDLVRIEGSFEELLRGAQAHLQAAEAGYVHASYTDSGHIVDAAARLRTRYPHLLAALPKAVAASAAPRRRARTEPGTRAASARAVLADFWATVNGEEAGAVTIDVLEGALSRAREEQRQGVEEGCALAS
jgi:exonuclease SbcD